MARKLFSSILFSALCSTAAWAATPTFHKDVLPILQKNCQACHRPGEVAPMAFLTYDGTRPWAKAIKTAVVSRKMPPWFADAKYGHFANDRRLSDADIATLSTWVDAGAPAGDAKDAPMPVAWNDGWRVKPDLTYDIGKPYPVPSTGTIDYTYVVVPSGLKQDTWIVDGEVRPGNRAVVHHASVHIRPPGSQWLKDAKPGIPYVPPHQANGDAAPPAPVDPRVNQSNEWFVGYAPGVAAISYFDPTGRAAKLIPAGSDLVFEMHYTTNGKPADDLTKVGFVIAKAPPQQRLLTVPVVNAAFAIPPGNPNFEDRAYATFNQPVELVYSQPHMHLRGKSMDVLLHYPNKENETLVSVPNYDFNWQLIYFQKNRTLLPKGTQVELISHWDNSANNKYNPDPKATVRWGDQSWDEMNFAWVGVIVDRNVDPNKVVTSGKAAVSQ